jgi:TRAP-type C4-dicarboxylate transport system permease small subunit
MMKKLKRVFDIVLKTIETNFSAVLMVIVLVGFILTILFRYLLKLSIAQIDEAIVIAFTWMAMFASPNGTKNDAHVSFTVIYDSLGPRAKAVNDILFKVILVILLGILLWPAWDMVNFFKMRRTPMLHLSFRAIYMPFIFFLVSTIYHLVENLVKDIKGIRDIFKGRNDFDKNVVTKEE